jgi:hypothetical protein
MSDDEQGTLPTPADPEIGSCHKLGQENISSSKAKVIHDHNGTKTAIYSVHIPLLSTNSPETSRDSLMGCLQALSCRERPQFGLGFDVVLALFLEREPLPGSRAVSCSEVQASIFGLG